MNHRPPTVEGVIMTRTTKTVFTILALLVIPLGMLGLGGSAGDPTDGVSGVIHFRDGRQVPFEHFGEIDKVEEPVLYGYLGNQRVKYKLHELGEIHFVNASANYNNPGQEEDECLIVSRSGDRFTLRGVELQGSNRSTGTVYYVYLDPITTQRKAGSDGCGVISHITMGDDVGPLKRNPKNGQFFPAIYNFDPFTGQKLEWTSVPED